MSDFVVHTPEQLAAHDAATSKRYLEALRELQAKIAALEKDAVLYGFLKDATWNIENFSRPGAPDVQWSVSFYSNYGALPHEEDPSKAIAAAMKGGA